MEVVREAHTAQGDSRTSKLFIQFGPIEGKFSQFRLQPSETTGIPRRRVLQKDVYSGAATETVVSPRYVHSPEQNEGDFGIDH
jgi:hypothetical protein